jgi:molybdenum-dependent DNA-binding transcriptional regulator ModE
MQFDPELWLRLRNKKVTARQMRILTELAATHSQTQAAINLGISVPVLHRQVKSLVQKLGLELVVTTPNGTWLTPDGQLLLRIYQRYQEMLKTSDEVALYCTPITYELLKRTIVDNEKQGKKYRISLNSDEQNLRALYLGRADLVIFDDPMNAIEFEGFKEDKIIITDLFNDTLIHNDSGIEYIRYKYGAQRLGFRYLDTQGQDYRVLHEISDVNYLVSSSKSYFINKSFIELNDLELENASDPAMFIHPIMAVSINPTDELRELVRELKRQAIDIY